MLFAIKRRYLCGKLEMESTKKLLILISLVALTNCEISKNKTANALVDGQQQPAIPSKHSEDAKNAANSGNFTSDIEEFEHVMLAYVGDVLNRQKINIVPGVYIQKTTANSMSDRFEKKSFNENLISTIKDFAETHALRVDMARAMSTGRIFFFKGKLKEV